VLEGGGAVVVGVLDVDPVQGGVVVVVEKCWVQSSMPGTRVRHSSQRE